MLFTLLLFATQNICLAQSMDYSSVASYIHHLIDDDLSHVDVLIADDQDDLTTQVLQKLSFDRKTSIAVADFHHQIGKVGLCILI